MFDETCALNLMLFLIDLTSGSLLDSGNLNRFCNDMISTFGNSKAVHIVIEEEDYSDHFKDEVADMSKDVKVQTFKGNYASLIDLDREELVLYSSKHFQGSLDEFDMNRDAWFIPSIIDLSIFVNDISKTFLRLDSEVYLYYDLGDSIMIGEVYGIKGVFKQDVNIATWNSSQGFEWLSLPNPLDRRTDWSGVELVAAVHPFPPLTIINMGFQDNVTSIAGIVSEAFNIVQEQLGFSSQIFRPKDRAWSIFLPNGTVQGLVGLLHRNEVDLAPISLMFTVERARVCDYSIPLYSSFFALSGVRSNQALVNFMAFIRIFTNPSWIFIFIVSFGVAIFITITVIMAKREIMHLKHDPEEFTIWNAFALVFTMILQRDYPAFPTRPPARVAYLTSSAVTFVLFSFYSAVLTSLMTAGSSEINIKSFTDVLANGYSPMVQANSGGSESMRTAPIGSAMRTMYDNAMKGNGDAFYEDIPEGVKRMRQDPTLIAVSTELSYTSYPDIVSIRPSDTYKFDLGFGFPKDSEIKPTFDHLLRKAIESGIMENVRLQYVKEDTGNDQDQEAFSLGYDNLIFPSLILSSGMFGALTAVIAEKLLRMTNLKVMLTHDLNLGLEFENHHQHNNDKAQHDIFKSGHHTYGSQDILSSSRNAQHIK